MFFSCLQSLQGLAGVYNSQVSSRFVFLGEICVNFSMLESGTKELPVEAFVRDPTVGQLCSLKKVELLEVAAHHCRTQTIHVEISNLA